MRRVPWIHAGEDGWLVGAEVDEEGLRGGWMVWLAGRKRRAPGGCGEKPASWPGSHLSMKARRRPARRWMAGQRAARVVIGAEERAHGQVGEAADAGEGAEQELGAGEQLVAVEGGEGDAQDLPAEGGLERAPGGELEDVGAGVGVDEAFPLVGGGLDDAIHGAQSTGAGRESQAVGRETYVTGMPRWRAERDLRLPEGLAILAPLVQFGTNRPRDSCRRAERGPGKIWKC